MPIEGPLELTVNNYLSPARRTSAMGSSSRPLPSSRPTSEAPWLLSPWQLVGSSHSEIYVDLLGQRRSVVELSRLATKAASLCVGQTRRYYGCRPAGRSFRLFQFRQTTRWRGTISGISRKPGTNGRARSRIVAAPVR